MAVARLAVEAMTVRGRRIIWGERTYLMAVVNATPDSFSGDGIADDTGEAVRLGLVAEAAGVDIIDVGGESTRPGASPVSADEEIHRVLPVIRALRDRMELPISIDTSKAAVAAAALDAGADMINDVWGLGADPALAALAARRNVPVVIMHNASDPSRVLAQEGVGAHYAPISSADVVADVARGLQTAVARARRAGIADNMVIVDPGIGFGKSLSQNLELLDRIGELRAIGLPLLIGPSRKSFIGLTLDVLPSERLEGTAAAVAVAIARGADMVRVHDAAVMARVARMADAIVRRPAPDSASCRR